MRTIGPEARMDEPDEPGVVTCNDQPLAIEPRLGEDVLFDELGRDRLNSPADRPLGPPDFGQTRRVPVFKRAKANQRTQGARAGD